MLDDKVVERISILIEKCLSDSINEVERAELYYYLSDDRYQQIFDQKIEGLFTRNIELLDMNLSWRNNLFYFAETPIQYVMSQISRWYDVDIVYDSEMPEFKLTGITLPTKLAYYRITDVAKDIDKASLFAFSSTQKILFYAVGSKLYGYDYNLVSSLFYELVKSFYRFVRFFTFS